MSVLKKLILLVAAAVTSHAALIVIDVDAAALNGTDFTQTGRINRNGTPSQWGTNKPFPGISTLTGDRAYRLYTASVPGYGSPVFYEVTLAQTMSLFIVAYTGSFNPANLASGYLGDAGGSGPSTTFQVTVPDGDTLLAIVVHEVNPGGGLGAPFDLTVTAYADSNRTALPTGVPEPATLAISGAALVAIGLWRRRLTDTGPSA